MKIPLLVAALFLAALPVSAQDAPPPNINELLEALESLQKLQEENRVAGFATLIQQINTAAASPGAAMDLYEKAVMSTEFQGRTRENTIFQEWKRKNADKLRDKSFQASLQLHLRYLALTLRAAAGEKRDVIAADLVGYTGDVITLGDQSGLHPDWMGNRSAVDRGILFQALQLQGRINGIKDWEMNPANVDGIFEKFLLPELRAAKDPRTLAYWDRRISLAEKNAADSAKNIETNTFAQIHKPNLLWMRAKESAS